MCYRNLLSSVGNPPSSGSGSGSGSGGEGICDGSGNAILELAGGVILRGHGRTAWVPEAAPLSSTALTGKLPIEKGNQSRCQMLAVGSKPLDVAGSHRWTIWVWLRDNEA